MNPGFDTNTLRDNPIGPGDRGIENVVDPTKVIRPDGRSEKEDKASNLLTQSNYDSFIQKMKNSPSFVEEFSGFYLNRSQAFAAFGGDTALMELYTELMSATPMNEAELLAFLKAQSKGGTEYSEAFFQFLKQTMDSSNQVRFKSQILQAAGRYGDMASGGHRLQMILKAGGAMSEYMFPEDGKLLNEILSRVTLLESERLQGQDVLSYLKETYQGNRNVLLNELFPFFSGYIHRTHDMGAARGLMSLITHQTAAYINGDPDKVLEAFSGLTYALNMEQSVRGRQGASMLLAGLLRKREEKGEDTFGDKLISLLKSGLSTSSTRELFMPMLKSMLRNESVYMPFLHFMVPVNYGGQSLFSEIWVDPDSGGDSPGRQAEKSLRMLIKMEVKELGMFDMVLDYKESGKVEIQLHYPKKLSGGQRQIESAINAMIEKNHLTPAQVSLCPMKEPLKPVDVFKNRIMKEKEIVNVRI